MASRTKREFVDVVQIDSSDDENEARGNDAHLTKVATRRIPQTEEGLISLQVPTPIATGETLVCRSFWKAGDYSVGATSINPSASGCLEHARVHPKFLHSNATSHKWAFGAIAELLDNAVDEIQNGATFVKLDKIDIAKDNSPALLFQDDGGGMDPDGIRKCMSLGYSTKKSNTTIGQYGNGFKTSTMRLGADVLVFSRATRGSKATQSVGLLSYTFLRRTGQDDVIVPMIDFDLSGRWPQPIIYGSQEDWFTNLNTILEWSPYASKEELMQQFEDIGSHGTKVMVYNLWLNDEGIYELNFDDDDEDIRLRDEANYDNTKVHKRVAELRSHISYRLRYSLRDYTSMLYLSKFENFRIILRGKPIEQFNIADELRYPKVALYKPQVTASNLVATEIKLGFIKEAPSIAVCGFNVYHKNRLIRPFWKVTADGSSKGHGVVGVLEANFIEPAHDKQDFERSSLFVRLESKLKQMLMEYWYNHCHLFGYHSPLLAAANTQKKASVKPTVGNTKKFLPADKHTTGASNFQETICLDEAVTSHPATISPNLRCGTGGNVQAYPEHEITGSDDQTAMDDIVHLSTDQLCEENLQLFMRCEEYTKKEIELRKTVDDLEKEVEEAKSKCSQLSTLLEFKKMEKAMKQQQAKAS